MPKYKTEAVHSIVATGAETGKSSTGNPFVNVEFTIHHTQNDSGEWDQNGEYNDQRFSFAPGAVEYSAKDMLHFGVTMLSETEFQFSGKPAIVEEYVEPYNGRRYRKFRPHRPRAEAPPADDTDMKIIFNAMELAQVQAAGNAQTQAAPPPPPATQDSTPDPLPF